MSGSAGVRRVLQVHTRYRQAGGEDRAVEAERILLEEDGVGVRQVIFDNAELGDSRSLIGDIRLAVSAVWSRSAADRVAEQRESSGRRALRGLRSGRVAAGHRRDGSTCHQIAAVFGDGGSPLPSGQLVADLSQRSVVPVALRDDRLVGRPAALRA